MMIGKVEDRVTGVHAKPAVVENGSCVFRCVLKSFVNGLFCVLMLAKCNRCVYQCVLLSVF